ncbi:unnamed protein product, partial [Leptidea sinapis]
MSVTHSPKKDGAQKKPKMISTEGSSSSQPDLSRFGIEEPEHEIFLCVNEKHPKMNLLINLMKILWILREASAAQMESIKSMSQNVTTSITEKLEEIKLTQEFLMEENKNLKSQVASLADTVKSNKEIITSLMNQMQILSSDLQTSPMTHSKVPAVLDDVILEIQERTTR